MHAEEEYLLAVLEAGGSGYVLLKGFQTKREPEGPDPLAKLPERERDVLQQTVQGFSSSWKPPPFLP